MTSVGFTGTRSTKDHEQYLKDYLNSDHMRGYFSINGMFVTGACVGWDTLVGIHCAYTYPDARHLVIVPADRSRVDTWWEDFSNVEVMYMPDGSSYRDRNKEIVAWSDHVFYCADYTEDHGKSKRSGTWMTKRIAEAAGRPVTGIVLNNESDS